MTSCEELGFTGDQLETVLLKQLGLARIDDCAIESALAARRVVRARDQAEWEALDQTCKAFLLDYLAGGVDRAAQR